MNGFENISTEGAAVGEKSHCQQTPSCPAGFQGATLCPGPTSWVSSPCSLLVIPGSPDWDSQDVRAREAGVARSRCFPLCPPWAQEDPALQVTGRGPLWLGQVWF